MTCQVECPNETLCSYRHGYSACTVTVILLWVSGLLDGLLFTRVEKQDSPATFMIPFYCFSSFVAKSNTSIKHVAERKLYIRGKSMLFYFLDELDIGSLTLTWANVAKIYLSFCKVLALVTHNNMMIRTN